ncbi:sigma-70 family RNA polymerase sigma factor [Bacillus cereus]|uniref:sigma-70 family RNA polymerase sigma factor n=1 Tax=Bacillus mycoides TaxID=1405 RepID=UPI002E22DC21|nr:sigma-70 family RNA polymerase sigma factor [Bacillus cereus]MED1405277.1 sigma-70 family RNA polymerase sigma factor [Bacillus mycoides]
MSENVLSSFYEKYKQQLNEPVMQYFLKDAENYYLLERAILKPTAENRGLLDAAFKVYFKNIKIVNYISKLVYFYSVDFDKKISRYNKRNCLYEDFLVIAETVPRVDETYINYDKKQECIKDCVTNKSLFSALNMLTDRQLKILDLIYVHKYSNKEVANILQESEQIVSYHHRKAIKKLKNILSSHKQQGVR